MSNRRDRNNRRSVKGPSSALTSFLQERGITTSNLGNGYAPRSQRRANQTPDNETVTITENSNSDENVVITTQIQPISIDEEPEEEEEEEIVVETVSVRVTRSASARATRAQQETSKTTKKAASTSKKNAKKRKGKRADSDSDSDFELDITPVLNHPKAQFSSKNRGPGIQLCVRCGCRFMPTSSCRYSVESNGYLCLGCSNQNPDSPNRGFNQRLLKKVKRESKLKTGCDWFEDSIVPRLEDLCIQTACENIAEINSLEGIGEFMLEKISRILSKHRKLNSDTLKLFLQPDANYLCLFDCARLTQPDIAKIVQTCEKLETLKLYFCGRMNDPLTYLFSNGFTYLTELLLHGAFLVTEDGFTKLLEGLGPRLDKLSIQQAPHFVIQSMESLVTNCRGLTFLELSHCESIDKECIALLSQGPSHGKSHVKSSKVKEEIEDQKFTSPWLCNLTYLNLSFLHPDLDDSAILPLLPVIGSALETLKLDGWTLLTDNVIIQGIEPCCKSLIELSLMGAEEITPEGWRHLFNAEFADRGSGVGFHRLNLANCSIENDDKVLLSLFRQSSETLQSLNLSGWDSLTHDGIKLAFTQHPPKHLTDINFSWCRELSDPLAELIVQATENLEELSVWGCHKVTTWFKGQNGLKIVGRECDTL